MDFMENNPPSKAVEIFLLGVEQDYGAGVREACQKRIAENPDGFSFQHMESILRKILDEDLDIERTATSLNTPFCS